MCMMVSQLHGSHVPRRLMHQGVQMESVLYGAAASRPSTYTCSWGHRPAQVMAPDEERPAGHAQPQRGEQNALGRPIDTRRDGRIPSWACTLEAGAAYGCCAFPPSAQCKSGLVLSVGGDTACATASMSWHVCVYRMNVQEYIQLLVQQKRVMQEQEAMAAERMQVGTGTG